ncbi:TPA: DUF2087 domain-containing protein, partial [Streptococcus suis]
NGKLITIPKKKRSKEKVFCFLYEQIVNRGNYFTEKEINSILKMYYDDYAILRRYLVDYGFLARDRYGLEYVTVNKDWSDYEKHCN